MTYGGNNIQRLLINNDLVDARRFNVDFILTYETVRRVATNWRMLMNVEVVIVCPCLFVFCVFLE